jgi:hypothetical protein
VLAGDVDYPDTLFTDPERDARMMLVGVSRAAGDARLCRDL